MGGREKILGGGRTEQGAAPAGSTYCSARVNLNTKVLDFVKSGGPAWIRTRDQSVMSRPLCR